MHNRIYSQEELTYEKKLVVLGDHVDMTRHLRMAELFRLFEEVAVAHTEDLGCTRVETLDKGLLWIITRQMVKIGEMPEYDDELIVRGWQGEMMHLFFPRFFEVEKKGRVIIRGQALWALIDEESRSMIMPEDYDIYLPGRPGSDDMILPAIVIPESAGEPVSSEELVTRFSQMDINGHMNNAGYFNMLDDAIWREVSSGLTTDTAKAEAIMPKPKSLYINYINELPAGVHLTLKQYKEGSTLYFDGSGGSRTYFKVRLTY